MRAGIAPAAVELGKEASPRVRLAGLQQESEYDLRATLDQLVADKAVLEKNLQAAQSLQSACKAWLERLRSITSILPSPRWTLRLPTRPPSQQEGRTGGPSLFE